MLSQTSTLRTLNNLGIASFGSKDMVGLKLGEFFRGMEEAQGQSVINQYTPV